MYNHYFERIPIAIYLGWILIAFITNVSYVLTLHEWSGWGLSTPLWTVIYLTIAAAIALHFMYHHGDVAFNLVFIWAFVGIAVKNSFEELFVSAAALFLVMVIGAFILFLSKKEQLNLPIKNTPHFMNLKCGVFFKCVSRDAQSL